MASSASTDVDGGISGSNDAVGDTGTEVGSKRKGAPSSDSGGSSVPRGRGRPRENQSKPPTGRGKGGRPLRSKVWKDFTKVEKDGEEWAVCHHCKRNLTGYSSSGTSHLISHLKVCPFRKGKEATSDPTQTTINLVEKEDGAVEMESWSYNQGIVRRAIAKMIVVHEYSLNMVEHEEFRNVLRVAQPLFKPFSRNTIRSDIIKMYNDEKTHLKGLLSDNEGRIAITTDMWTAGTQKRSYMAITAHYIDNEWELQNRILREV